MSGSVVRRVGSPLGQRLPSDPTIVKKRFLTPFLPDLFSPADTFSPPAHAVALPNDLMNTPRKPFTGPDPWLPPNRILTGEARSAAFLGEAHDTFVLSFPVECDQCLALKIEPM